MCLLEDLIQAIGQVENKQMEQCLSVSKMKELGTWGTELEILAFYGCATQLYTYIAIVVVKGGIAL